MREIKFRAWEKEEGAMIYDANVMGANDPEIQEMWDFMQYTGLKDKNGKEIYEGDIVKETCGIGVVIYQEEFARFAVEFKEQPMNDYCGIFYNDIGIWQEVIGNIYENPELLKGEVNSRAKSPLASVSESLPGSAEKNKAGPSPAVNGGN